MLLLHLRNPSSTNANEPICFIFRHERYRNYASRRSQAIVSPSYQTEPRFWSSLLTSPSSSTSVQDTNNPKTVRTSWPRIFFTFLFIALALALAHFAPFALHIDLRTLPYHILDITLTLILFAFLLLVLILGFVLVLLVPFLGLAVFIVLDLSIIVVLLCAAERYARYTKYRAGINELLIRQLRIEVEREAFEHEVAKWNENERREAK